MDHNIIYFSIPAYNTEELRNFYVAVFGWKFKQIDEKNDIWTIDTGKVKMKVPEVEGLLMKRRPMQQPMNYIHVESVDKYLKLIQNNRGKIYLKKTTVEGAGWIAIAADPEGNPFALWQNK